MKTKIFFILICFACGELTFSQNITNTLGTSGLFTIKDGATNYFSLSQSTGQVNILKTLRLENTTSSTTGVIYCGVDRFIHNFGIQNTFLGVNSGNFTMSGLFNTAVGFSSLFSNTAGYSNTAVGVQSLFSNTTGVSNTAMGYQSLLNNTTGVYNTAVGMNSLNSNTTGSFNSAFGLSSLYQNTTGNQNSAFGWNSLNSNTAGFQNSAFGTYSLRYNTTGSYNSAFGLSSLESNTIGSYNYAFGWKSLNINTTGNQNSAFGPYSLNSNTTGSNNTALGYNSLSSNTVGFNNTAMGHHSLQYNTGNYNTALGYNAGSTITTGANLTCIGIDAIPTSPTALDQITLGNGFVTSLRCNVTTITSLSDMRDKKNITDLTLGLDFITKLKPRQFNWDKREWYDNNISDGSKMKEAPTAGFIAQELDEVQTTSNAEWVNLVLKDNPEKWEATPGNLLPIMVKAIQELKTENDELKEKLLKFEQMQSVLAVEIDKLKTNNADTKEVKLTEK